MINKSLFWILNILWYESSANLLIWRRGATVMACKHTGFIGLLCYGGRVVKSITLPNIEVIDH